MAVTVGLPVVLRPRVPMVMAVLRVAALVVVLPLPVEPVAVPEVVEAGAANKPWTSNRSPVDADGALFLRHCPA